jgi:hypothetical protein
MPQDYRGIEATTTLTQGAIELPLPLTISRKG